MRPMRTLPILVLAAASLAARADFQFPPVPVMGTIQAEFTLTTTSGAALSGIPVSLSVPDGCGQVSPGQLTTDGSGKGHFTFVAGNRTGVCTIAGSSGGTTLFGRTTVFRTEEIVLEGALNYRSFVSSQPNDFLVTVKAGGLPLGLLPLEVDGQFSPAGPTVPAGPQVVSTDVGGKARIRTTGATQTGIYDLPVRIAGVTRHLRLRQFVDNYTFDRWSQYLNGDPWNRVLVTLPDHPVACAMGASQRDDGPRPPGISEYTGTQIELSLSCTGPITPMRVRMEYPDPIPADGQMWNYTFNPRDLWHFTRLPAEISGNVVTFTVPEFTDYGNGSWEAVVGIGLPGAPVPVQRTLQGMWWAGFAENGWGMSLVQGRDYPAGTFAAIFAYDSAGDPTWWVMPDGDWSTSRGMTFTTSAYSPVGTPWNAYESPLLVVGPSVGRVQIRFADANNATMEYALDGMPGRKTIQRQVFGGAASATRPDVTGMWWGGQTQNGWGIAVLQQGDALFNVWYTYGAGNKPMWFVMSGGRWSGANTYEGRIYRTRGSPWLAGAYDPSRFQVTDVGEYRVTFSGYSATFTYTLEGNAGTLQLQRAWPF